MRGCVCFLGEGGGVIVCWGCGGVGNGVSEGLVDNLGRRIFSHKNLGIAYLSFLGATKRLKIRATLGLHY